MSFLAGCLTSIVFLVSCDCYCSVALPHGAVTGLQCVIVILPNHTHLLFCILNTAESRAKIKYN